MGSMAVCESGPESIDVRRKPQKRHASVGSSRGKSVGRVDC